MGDDELEPVELGRVRADRRFYRAGEPPRPPSDLGADCVPAQMASHAHRTLTDRDALHAAGEPGRGEGEFEARMPAAGISVSHTLPRRD